MSQPVVTATAEGLTFTWPDVPILVTLSRIREGTHDTTAELQAVYSNGTGKSKTLTHQKLNLLTSKDRLANELHKKHDAPWLSMLEQVGVLALRHLRQGAPIESLTPTDTTDPSWFVLNPLLYHQNPTVLYGPGDSWKSFLALYCALLLCNGATGANLHVAPTPWRVLWLDWEMSANDVRARVKLLQAGDARLVRVPDYRRCVRPLADEIADVKKVVSDGAYDVLILDSLAMAAGGQELERADSAIRFNAALRSLNCTSLVIGHTPKPQADQKERSLYGSVFFHNLCRVSWEVQREGDTVGLYQRKNNLGRKHEPIGFSLLVDDQSATVTDANLMDEPVLAKGLSIVERTASYLAEHPNQTLDHVAEVLELNPKSLAVAVSRAKKHGMRRFESHNGIWNVVLT
jgi:hypothetical protein